MSYTEIISKLNLLKDCYEVDDEVLTNCVSILKRMEAHPLPAPKGFFSHGPKSIVYEWHTPEKSIYLTVSSKNISLMITTNDAIEFKQTYQFIHE